MCENDSVLPKDFIVCTLNGVLFTLHPTFKGILELEPVSSRMMELRENENVAFTVT